MYSWRPDHTAAKCGGSDGGRQPVQEHLHPAEQTLLLPVQLAETSEVRHTAPDVQYLISFVTLRLILEQTVVVKLAQVLNVSHFVNHVDI